MATHATSDLSVEVVSPQVLCHTILMGTLVRASLVDFRDNGGGDLNALLSVTSEEEGPHSRYQGAYDTSVTWSVRCTALVGSSFVCRIGR